MAQSHFNASRRRFLTALAAGATLHRQRFLNAAETDPRLARVLAHTISIDMHSHVGIPFGKPNAPLPQFDLQGEMNRLAGRGARRVPGYRDHSRADRLRRRARVLARGARDPRRRGSARARSRARAGQGAAAVLASVVGAAEQDFQARTAPKDRARDQRGGDIDHGAGHPRGDRLRPRAHQPLQSAQSPAAPAHRARVARECRAAQGSLRAHRSGALRAPLFARGFRGASPSSPSPKCCARISQPCCCAWRRTAWARRRRSRSSIRPNRAPSPTAIDCCKSSRH